MARQFSNTMKEAMAAQETGEREVVLLILEHSSLSSPIRLVNNMTAVTHNGDTYQAFAFEAVLPEQSDRVRSASLRIDNADRRLVSELRSIQDPMTITFRVVLLSDPDTTELEVGPLRVESADIGLTEINLKLGAEPVAYEPFPQGRFTPADFPGLF